MFRVFLGVSLLVLTGPTARAVVISEIHYNPPLADSELEFVELAADATTPEDLSGYSFADGITYTLPAGTILPAGGFLVIARNPAALAARHGIAGVLGPFTGLLDGSGERLTLVSEVGIEVQSLRYGEKGKWPAAPDGTGHTLSIRNVHLDASEPESWRASAELGGTPGRRNFAATGGPTVIQTVFVETGMPWRYKKGNMPFSTAPADWRAPLFDDSSWASGPTVIGYEAGTPTVTLATVLTDMQNGYPSAALRKRFTLTAENLALSGDFFFGIDYDDGFCAFVNGVEVARAGCGEPGAALEHNQLATISHEAGGGETLYLIPKVLLVAGENVVAVAGHNATLGSSDFSLNPRILHQRQVSSTADGLDLAFNELVRGAAPGGGWVELYNRAPAAVDLSSMTLTDNPDRVDPYTVPAGRTIAAGGFVTFSEAETGLDLSTPEVSVFLHGTDGLVAAAAAFCREPPPGASAGGYAEARFPDGASEIEWVTITPTPGAANAVEAVTGLVINEIFYNPPQERPGEFLELYNRSGVAIDLSGFSFTGGIDFVFPAGTTIAPGAYLVLAKEPAVVSATYGVAALGPYGGVLSNRGESLSIADRAGNPVDQVRYHDDGRWSQWADGGGSSLELIDPFQENGVPSAWDASDETAKSDWEILQFHVADYIPAGESELHLYLLTDGVALIDEVEIRRAGGANLIPNAGFEAGTSPWRIEGTHVASRRVTYDRFAGSACLELAASGKGDTLVNRIEIDTNPALTRGPYDIRVAARWQRGGSGLIAHGEFTAGSYCCSTGPSTNISGNSMAARLRLTVPADLGTPGAENSARRKLREATGSGNLGPVISAVEASPPSPLPGAPARISARVSDSDGVSRVRVFYRTGSAQGAFTAVDLSREPAVGGAGDIYAGQIPGMSTGTKVVFYVEAQDAIGAARRFPVEAPARTSLYLVSGAAGGTLDTCGVILDDQRTAELTSRPLHSNDLLDGTFVFNNERAFHNIGFRYRGSPWGRPGRTNFRVRFPKDDRFHRGRKEINLSSRASSGREGAAYFLAGRVGTPAHPTATADNLYCTTILNGGPLGLQSIIQPVDGDYLETWYGEDAGGPCLKAVGRLAFDDAGNRTAWEGANLIHRGTDTENYRGYWMASVNQDQDDWDPFIELTRVLDQRVTPNEEFDALIAGVVDLETFLRTFAVRTLTSDWDAWGVGNGHNGYIVVDPLDGRWDLLAFDMDNAWGSASSTLFPTGDTNIVRMLGRQPVRRVYFRVLWDMIHGYWASGPPDGYLDGVQAATGINMQGFKSFLAGSSDFVRGQVTPWTTQAFRIVTNNGLNLEVDGNTVTLEGEASIQVETILLRLGAGQPAVFEPAWTSPVRWRHTFTLTEAETELQFLAFDTDGEPTGAVSITVTSLSLSGAPRVNAWFPNAGPSGTEVSFFGTNLDLLESVRFGLADAVEITIDSPEMVRVVAPAAVPPLPLDLTVDVRLVFEEGVSIDLPKVFRYSDFQGAQYLRGDANQDGTLEVSDAFRILLYLVGEVEADCLEAFDVDGTGAVLVTDSTVLLNHIFLSGPAPAPPYPECAFGAEVLGCDSGQCF
jgi:hypothetical protein